MDFWNRIDYCPPNVTIYDIWIDHGMSHCFYDTLSSIILVSFILFFGTIQLIMYHKYATRIDSTHTTTSKLYCFQLILLCTLPLLSLARFVLESFIFVDAHVYGYTVSVLDLEEKCLKNLSIADFYH